MSCPKNGDAPKSPLPPIGSPGAVGRLIFSTILLIETAEAAGVRLLSASSTGDYMNRREFIVGLTVTLLSTGDLAFSPNGTLFLAAGRTDTEQCAAYRSAGFRITATSLCRGLDARLEQSRLHRWPEYRA